MSVMLPISAADFQQEDRKVSRPGRGTQLEANSNTTAELTDSTASSHGTGNWYNAQQLKLGGVSDPEGSFPLRIFP